MNSNLPAPYVLQNEFAIVEVQVERIETGDRLVIRDVTSGESIRLDPFELEALARSSHETLRALLGLLASHTE